MKIRAKFSCNAIVPQVFNGGTKGIYMNTVYSTTGENADYAKSTPWGSLSMGIDEGTLASEFFERGESYYVTFEKAPKE